MTETFRPVITDTPTVVIPTPTNEPTLTPSPRPTSDPRIEPHDVTQLQILAKLNTAPPISEALDVAFSPDSHLLASAHCTVSGTSDDCIGGVIVLWDVMSAQMLTTLEVNGERQTTVVFSPDRRYLASSGFGNVFLWDVKGLTLVTTLSGNPDPGYSQHLAFSPDGSVLAYLEKSSKYELVMWDVSTQKIRIRLPVSGILMRFISYAFSPDGKSVAIASCQKVDDAAAYCIEGQTTLLDIASGQVAQTLEGDGQAVAFSPDGHLLAISAFGNIVLWDTLSGQRLFRLSGNSPDIVSLAFSPDGHLLVSGEHDQGENFLVWDTTTGQLLFTKNYGFYISSVSFSSDGKYIAIARLGSPLLLGLP